MVRPQIDRPVVPEGYGIEQADAFVSWEFVQDRLRESQNYWLSTTGATGSPHVVPRWGVWIKEMFWYDGSPETLHARNAELNPECALHLEDGSSAVIVYGGSTRSKPIDRDVGKTLSAEFRRKYSPTYEPGASAWSGSDAGGLRVLRPRLALAWTDFPKDVTRFRFD
ncbi:MAG: pyridoxamine 5'-phosphate oxidase family protein [Acidimicrobiia bacterium]